MANEKRLIDANALLAGICKDCGNGCDLVDNYCLLATEIMKAPTVDAAEVVRCKACAVPHNKWTRCPKLNGLVPPSDFYCAYGERKE